MRSTLVATVFALLVAAAPAAAQQINDSRFDRAASPTLDTATPPVVPAAPAVAGHDGREPADASVENDGGFSFRPVLHALGGALVGGWVGYVGAQVVKSDWDKENNGTFAGQRTTWVAAGAAIGVVGSWLIGETRAPRPGPLTPRPSPRDRSIITARDIRDSGLQNALDVVRALRSEWLQTRGTNSWGETTGGTMDGFGDSFEAQVKEGRDKIIVYMDDIRIGGVDDMAQIPAHTLTSIRFMDGRRATYVYGTGHAHGAILLSTEQPAP